MKKVNKTFYINIIFYILIVFILLYNMNNFEITFDAAMNFQVSKSFAESGDYATYYNVYEKFDHNIQTGAPVIIPTAIINSILGSSSINMQVVTTIYLFLLIILIQNYIFRYSNYIISIMGSILILAIPTLNSNAWMGLGEIVTGFWMFLFFMLFFKGREEENNKLYFTSGVCFALGYLTKTVFLICLPAILCIFLYDNIIKKNKNLKGYLIIFSGILMPIFIFEFYKLMSLGIDNYIKWWLVEIERIIGQMGLSDRHLTQIDSINKFSKAKLHIERYANHFNLSVVEIIIFYLIPAAYFLWKFKKNKKIDIENLFLYMISLTYFIWWCFLIPTSKTWSRRILLGHILIVLLIIIIFSSIIGDLWKMLKSKKYNYIMLNFLIIFSLIFLSYYYVVKVVENTNLVYSEIKYQRSLKKNTLEMAEEIKELPQDAVLYGISWWQNPVFSVLTDRMFFDLSLVTEINSNSYFIEDHFMATGEPNGVNNRVKSQYKCDLIASKGTNKMYKLNSNFAEEVRKQGNYVEIVFADNYVSNYSIYLDLGNGFNENDKQNFNAANGSDIALFKIPYDLKDVRFDFTTIPNKIEIKSIRTSINKIENVLTPEYIYNNIYNVHDISAYYINEFGNFEIQITGKDPHFQIFNLFQ